MLEVLEPAQTLDLTTLEKVKQALDIDPADTSKDALLSDLITRVSSDIQNPAGEYQFFVRQKYNETVPGHGTLMLQLARTPIVEVTSVLHNSDPITDYQIADRLAGHLYRKCAWWWTAGVGWHLTGYVIPRSEHPEFVVEYKAGYIPPKNAVKNITGITQAASARVTTSTAHGLSVGDFVTFAGVGGMVEINGVRAKVKTIVSATQFDVEVNSSGFTAYTSGGTVDTRNLEWDIEDAAIVTVIDRFRNLSRDENVKSKSVGDLSITYGDRGVQQFPNRALVILEKYRRLV
ncbi:MAG TPA: ubiquitin-activating E1 FCCH domain-containing protein [Candidatus Acidoferrales bacterium]|nr:ubiquitin-activating E1 FCCH domain-containing protein [Candidatus Acidoferrales bacterium]